MNKKLRGILHIALLMLAVAVANCSSCRRKAPTAGELTVYFLDVGQGDSELIELPDGEFILIDSGDRGAPTVELLRQRGVSEIALIIATHPHSDHIGQMREVMARFKVKEFWDSGFPHPTKTYADMLEEIRDRGIKFETPKRGETRQFGQVLIEVLNPAPELPDDNPNNASLVVRMTFAGKRFLFAGDAEVAAWRQMLSSERERLQADLLKAAHHGSSNGTSEEVLAAVRPSVVIISCAVGNDYHHPHPRVIKLLSERRNQIRLYRTDLQGTITARCDAGVDLAPTLLVTTEKQVALEALYRTGDEVAAIGRETSKGDRPVARTERSGRRSR
jgi:competence protein ComEC